MTLDQAITAIPGIGESSAKKLAKLELHTVGDLLNHFPRKHLDLSHPQEISTLSTEGLFCFKACLVKFNNFRYKRGFLQTAVIADSKGKLPVIWFNMPFLDKSLQIGEWYYFTGLIKMQKNKFTLVSPDFEPLKDEQLHSNRIVPVYPETAGISSKVLRSKLNLVLESTPIPETIPEHIVHTNKLIDLNSAYKQIHFPDNFDELTAAQTRLSFDDLLAIQLKSLLTKKDWAGHKTHQIKIDSQLQNDLLTPLPFKLTSAQIDAIGEIFRDISQNQPMNRLLQGDVGSGKTIVAISATLQVLKNNLSVIILAPTQILAQQHFETFSKLLEPFGITPTLVTSASKKSKIQDLKSKILIGTHALLHSKIDLAKIGLLVIDEQHRFGVLQRTHFLKGKTYPHVLTMTATPIPRTIALSLYGHLEISNLKTPPSGRLKIKTWVVPESKRASSYDWITKQLEEGRQAFIVCPFIEESETENLKNIKAATKEFDNLKSIFKKFKLDLLHGKMKTAEKDVILERFRVGATQILVTTPVIEVGIDIPNATVMVIEGAERFGLAALHQLRGRVGRNNQQAYCLLFPSSPSRVEGEAQSAEGVKRLKLLEKYHSGLILSRLDLKLRGAGDIFGFEQSGYLDTYLPQFWDLRLRKAAAASANQIMSQSTELAMKTLNLLTPEVAKLTSSN